MNHPEMLIASCVVEKLLVDSPVEQRSVVCRGRECPRALGGQQCSWASMRAGIDRAWACRNGGPRCVPRPRLTR